MHKQIKTFDVQSVELPVSFEKAFTFIADPKNLPAWTAAFSQADEKSATLVTPKGRLPIQLKTLSHGNGTVDWVMTMPDGTVGKAFSRLTELPNGNTVYSFVLLAPPVPLEEVEGSLEAQRILLASELKKLATLFNY